MSFKTCILQNSFKFFNSLYSETHLEPCNLLHGSFESGIDFARTRISIGTIKLGMDPSLLPTIMIDMMCRDCVTPSVVLLGSSIFDHIHQIV